MLEACRQVRTCLQYVSSVMVLIIADLAVLVNGRNILC